VPSAAVLVFAELGVSGSMRPCLTFDSRGILSDKQSALVSQLDVFGETTTSRTNVLQQIRLGECRPFEGEHTMQGIQ
jgi:hypothetical protein